MSTNYHALTNPSTARFDSCIRKTQDITIRNKKIFYLTQSGHSAILAHYSLRFSLMRYFLVIATIILLTSPHVVSAAKIAKAPKIIAANTVVAGNSVVLFSEPQFAGKKVKVYATVKSKVRHKSKAIDSSGLELKTQEFLLTLDPQGNGTFVLTKLKDGRTYTVSISLKRLEPNIQWSLQSKWKKLHTTR